MNNNSGISTLTMEAEVILMCPKFISTVTIHTQGEQEQGALCRVENIGEKKKCKQNIYIYIIKTGEKISSCIWKCLLHNQDVLHDIKNSIILFHNVWAFLCSFCTSVLNIQHISLSSRIIMNIWSFYEHVFEQRRQQVLCQFVHEQCYKIISYLNNVQNIQRFI